MLTDDKLKSGNSKTVTGIVGFCAILALDHNNSNSHRDGESEAARESRLMDFEPVQNKNTSLNGTIKSLCP